MDLPSTLKPDEAAKLFDVVDVKEEEKEGCVSWTDPMGNVHWLRALVRLLLALVFSLAPNSIFQC